MPTYTITGPDGRDYSIDGPAGATKEQVIAQIQQRQQQQQQSPGTPGLLKSAASGLIEGAGAPGDLSQKALSGAPPQQPVDRNTYYGKLIDAMNAARNALELPTSQKIGNMVGMQPTQPVTGAEKAVQAGASMIPGAIIGGAGSLGGRATMGAAPAVNAVRQIGMNNMPTQAAGPMQNFGSRMAFNKAQQGTMPIGGPPAGPAGAAPGDALQNSLLRAGLKEGAAIAGHAIGGPLGGLAARFAPKVLGLE